MTEWKQAKLHPDCQVVFDGAYYSGPHRLIGQRLWVRATEFKGELYQDYTLVATHRRARRGQRRTLAAHLPPDKIHFLLQTPCGRARAAEIGPACATSSRACARIVRLARYTRRDPESRSSRMPEAARNLSWQQDAPCPERLKRPTGTFHAVVHEHVDELP